jgi:hypothetical protein
MPKTLEQRIAQLEKLIADFFTGGSQATEKSRKPGRRKAKKARATKKAAGRKSSRKSSRKVSRG